MTVIHITPLKSKTIHQGLQVRVSYEPIVNKKFE